jgi:hypothetical protein
MPSSLLLIAVVIFGAWLGASRLFGRSSDPHEFGAAFLVEALSWGVVFILALTAFAGGAFWSAVLAMQPVALAILGLGCGGILLASWLVALLRDSPESSRGRASSHSATSWEERWRPYCGKKVEGWMRSVDLGEGIQIDGRRWIINDEDTLVPADEQPKSKSLWDWIRWIIA